MSLEAARGHRGQDGLLLPGRRGEAGGHHEAALHSIGSVLHSQMIEIGIICFLQPQPQSS